MRRKTICKYTTRQLFEFYKVSRNKTPPICPNWLPFFYQIHASSKPDHFMVNTQQEGRPWWLIRATGVSSLMLKYLERFFIKERLWPSWKSCHSCGQSYKQFTLVYYHSRVVVTSKLAHIYGSRLVNYDRRGFITLATELTPDVSVYPSQCKFVANIY